MLRCLPDAASDARLIDKQELSRKFSAEPLKVIRIFRRQKQAIIHAACQQAVTPFYHGVYRTAARLSPVVIRPTELDTKETLRLRRYILLSDAALRFFPGKFCKMRCKRFWSMLQDILPCLIA